MDKVEFGRRIKEIRIQARLNLNDAAEKLGITRQALNAYENGDMTPGVDKLEKMTEIYNVTADYILFKTNKTNKKAPTVFDSYKEYLKCLVMLLNSGLFTYDKINKMYEPFTIKSNDSIIKLFIRDYDKFINLNKDIVGEHLTKEMAEMLTEKYNLDFNKLKK